MSDSSGSDGKPPADGSRRVRLPREAKIAKGMTEFIPHNRALGLRFVELRHGFWSVRV
jgi:hypothetical protein